MYLWKYWRETRIVFGVTLLSIAILFLLMLREPVLLENGHAPFSQISNILPLALLVQAFPVSFIAWLLGSFGIGRNLGERSGSYLLTRPRSRAFVIWFEWSLGIAQLLAIVALLNVVIGFQLHRLIVAAGDPLHGSIAIAGRPVSLVSIVCLNIGAACLLAGLVFSLTYFATVLVKHAKGVMLAMGALLGYVILEAVVEHYWPGFHLPTLVLQEFTHNRYMITGTADHLGLSIAMRAVVILLLPFAAQLALQKTDITN